MVDDWRIMSIEEVADIVGGGTPSTKNEANFNGDIPWITPKDLSGYNCRYISQGERNITNRGLRNSSARLLPKGTVLLTTRAPVGYVAIADNTISTNQGFRNLILHNGFLPEFFYYLLGANTEYLKSQASGTTFGELSGSTLKKLKFFIPPIPEQRAIAQILGALDDKIELNRRMNKILEDIAKAIFKSWFVYFEPVYAKAEGRDTGLPQYIADLFPDSFEDSELGRIPVGWNPGTFSNFITQRTERIGSLEFIVLSAVATGQLVRSDDYFSKRVYSKETLNYLLVEQYDFAFNPSRINIGSIGMYEDNAKGGVSPVYVVFRPEYTYRWFLKYYLRLPCTKAWINTLASGSVRQSLSYSDFASIPCIIPNKRIVQEFNKLWGNFQADIVSRANESKTLIELRHVLTDKLISGKLRVPESIVGRFNNN